MLTPQAFDSFLEERRRDFCGRTWLWNEIEGADWAKHRVVLIQGDPGVGKSAAIAQMVHWWRKTKVLAWHCCRHNQPSWVSAVQFVHNVAAMLSARHKKFRTRLEAETAK